MKLTKVLNDLDLWSKLTSWFLFIFGMISLAFYNWYNVILTGILLGLQILLFRELKKKPWKRQTKEGGETYG